MSEIQYIDVPITTNPEALADAAFSFLQGQVSGWSPNAGNLEVILIESLARMVADARDVASAVPRSIFRYYGNSLIGVPPISDVKASVNSTWTLIDNKGYTIPAGTQVGLRAAGDELIAFETAYEVVVPSGSTATAAGGVTLIAVLPGIEGNNLTGTVELIDTFDWISSIVTVGATSGGVDAESDDAYLNRLASELRLLTPRPILPQDFAIIAMADPGVGRAMALDGYNPANQTENNERMIALSLIDTSGEIVSSIVKSRVLSLLDSEREVNFVVNAVDPTYNTINVTCTYKVVTGADPTIVDGNVRAALQNYLSPGTWGSPSFSESANPDDWVNAPVIRYLELATVINNVANVNYITALTFAINPAALGTADVTMTGRVPLPRPGTINVTGSV
jgi:hypothetical protein